MLLQPIVDQLKVTVTDFRKVAGAANFAAAQEDLKATPAAYVIPLNDNAAPNTLQGLSVDQHVVERFGVIMAVSNAYDVRGDASNTSLQTYRSQVIQALLAFQPSADYDPIQYGGGQLLALDVTKIWWRIDFITGYYERKV